MKGTIAIAALASLASFFLGFFLGTIWQPNSRPEPSNFEECVLDEMRGQAKSLEVVAMKLCRDRFPNPDEDDSPPPPEPKIDDRIPPTDE